LYVIIKLGKALLCAVSLSGGLYDFLLLFRFGQDNRFQKLGV